MIYFLERTKTHHEMFLMSLENPLIIPKEKITRWHPEFNVENCSNIELAELPQPPTTEKASSAKDVLGEYYLIFNYYIYITGSQLIRMKFKY